MTDLDCRFFPRLTNQAPLIRVRYSVFCPRLPQNTKFTYHTVSRCFELGTRLVNLNNRGKQLQTTYDIRFSWRLPYSDQKPAERYHWQFTNPIHIPKYFSSIFLSTNLRDQEIDSHANLNFIRNSIIITTYCHTHQLLRLSRAFTII